jgi:hypothetical protein
LEVATLSIDGRLRRLSPALSAKERAVLVLRAWKEDVEPDPQMRWQMPAEQTREYNHYISLMSGANGSLAHYILVLQQMVEKVDLRYGWLLTVGLWALQIERRTPPDPEEQRRAEDLANALITNLRDGIEPLWQELRAVEIVLDEVAEEFDEEDPAHPMVRRTLNECKEKLTELHGQVSRYTGPFELPEPEVQGLGRVRNLVRRAESETW